MRAYSNHKRRSQALTLEDVTEVRKFAVEKRRNELDQEEKQGVDRNRQQQITAERERMSYSPGWWELFGRKQ